MGFLSAAFSPGNYQFGFTKSRSCGSCVNSVVSRAVSYLEDSKCSKVATVFFDKRKAFDSVVHNLLLNKMDADFRVDHFLIGMVRSFLSNRNQVVRVGDAISTKRRVSSGVPQGSVLGPHLFLLFIDNLQAVAFSNRAEIFLFADDSVLLKPIFHPADYSQLQNDVDAVNGWCLGNYMSLNTAKCKVMLLTYATQDVPMPPLELSGQPLERVWETRYLGVILQANPCTWTSHCRMTLKRCRAVFYCFRNFYRNNSPDCVLLLVFKCVIRSILDYCSDVIVPNSYYSEQFERLQKLVVRTYLHNFRIGYDAALLRCNMEYLSSRRAANCVVNLVKYDLCNHFILPNFFILGCLVSARRRTRGDGGKDLVPVRNYL